MCVTLSDIHNESVQNNLLYLSRHVKNLYSTVIRSVCNQCQGVDVAVGCSYIRAACFASGKV